MNKAAGDSPSDVSLIFASYLCQKLPEPPHSLVVNPAEHFLLCSQKGSYGFSAGDWPEKVSRKSGGSHLDICIHTYYQSRECAYDLWS